ncbi:hypothetical protein ACFX15_022297 [Malus domestica]
MYAETGLLFPYLQNSPQDFQQLDEFCRTQKSTASIIASPRLRWHCVYVEVTTVAVPLLICGNLNHQ